MAGNRTEKVWEMSEMGSEKGTDVPKMRTRAKMWTVASDRARRENVPRHILFYNGRFLRNSILHKNIVKSNEQNGEGITCIISAYSAYNVS